MVAAEVFRYVPSDPRLGRHVNHDPRSRRFPVRPVFGSPFRSVRWQRRVPVWDQGALGSCTGNAGLGCLGTDPFFATVDPAERGALGDFTERGAVALYAAATTWDTFPGTYPPDDTGSDGLSVAKALTNAGMISGYRHAFSVPDLLAGLMAAPCIVGTEWSEGMWNPNSQGLIHPTGAVQGGHEYVCDELIRAGDPFGSMGVTAPVDMLGFTNSWGESWADGGRHFMSVDEFGWLLARQGDATFFVAASERPPSPLPDPDAPPAPPAPDYPDYPDDPDESDDPDRVLAAAFRYWLAAKGL